MEVAGDGSGVAGRRSPGEDPARWLDDHEVAGLLASRVGQAEGADLSEAIALARATVIARASRLVESSAISDAPATLAVGDLDDEGAVALVELRSLRARQPYVFRDAGQLPGCQASLHELAAVTLPRAAELDPTVEHNAEAWSIRVTSTSQNLQLLGSFAGPLPDCPPGAIGVGFLVGVAPSKVRVQVVDGKAVLIDGYHRCVALLAAGVEVVPAIVVGSSPSGDEWPHGMLSPAVVLGERAPYVADYLEDKVSRSVMLRHIGRQITVSAEASDVFPSNA